jgi:hypothetical protein
VSHRLAALIGALAIVLAIAAPIGLTPVARAADKYELATKVHYVVQPGDRDIAVAVEATFTNLTPDPSGAYSVFETVPLAVHDVASSVTAKDAKGALQVKVARNDADVNVATVTLRDPLRYEKSATFTLSYLLPDGKDPSVRVRPSLVIFPVWSFGTKSEVSVDLPAAYEVRADGDTLSAARQGETTQLTSGTIADPSHWLALVTADRETAMVTSKRSVPLAGGTVDLQVRAWQDDPGWGESTLGLLGRVLPRLEKAIGVPYSRQGPLVVTEAVASPGGIGEAGRDVQEMQVAFDQPPFTVVHQAAHVWFGDAFASDRWIREGLASHYAAMVARDLKVALPYDPAARAKQLAKDAFPLASWGSSSSTDQESWAYAASWAAADRLAAAVGEQKLQLALQRIAAGVGGYDPVTGEKPSPAQGVVPAVDSRRLLDQLEAVSGKSLADEFAASVFGEPVKAELPARKEARDRYTALLARAGDWGAPEPVRQALAGWNFTDATTEIEAASSWLGDRDRLVADIERAGLSTPHQLRDRYKADGGGSQARDELNAERAVVDDYATTLERANRSRSVIERVGLLGGQDPTALLASANGLFADGHLRQAAETISRARLQLEGAQVTGILRLLTVLLVLVVAGGAVVYLARRPRRIVPRGKPAPGEAEPPPTPAE